MTAKTCIVIPCYNEAERFKAGEYLAFLENVPDIDFCFVNDGSRDNTRDVLLQFCNQLPGRALMVDYADNRGKAEAVRSGFLYVLGLQRYQAIAFADADLATPLSEMQRLIGIFYQEAGERIVMGSRIERMGITIERRLYRHYTGRLFAAVISILFRLNAYDTQCGAKVFDAGIARIVFEKPFLSQWLFDVEMLLRVRNTRADYQRIIHEIPLECWYEQGNSKIRFAHILKMPWQLCRIYFEYKTQMPAGKKVKK